MFSRSKSWAFFLLSLVFLYLLLTPKSLYALSLERLSLADLAREADFVAKGKISGSTVQETADKKWIYTVYSFSVSRCYRMTTLECPKSTSVVLLGGELEGRILDVPGVPDLNRLQNEVILFLSNGTLTGVGQGIFEIKEGKVFSPILKTVDAYGISLKNFESELFSMLVSTLKGACASYLCGEWPIKFIGPGSYSASLSINISDLTSSTLMGVGAWREGTHPDTHRPIAAEFFSLDGASGQGGMRKLVGLEKGVKYSFYAGTFDRLTKSQMPPPPGSVPDKTGFLDANRDFSPDLILIDGATQQLDLSSTPIPLHVNQCPAFVERLTGPGTNRLDVAISVGEFPLPMTLFCGAWPAGTHPLEGVPPVSLQTAFVQDGVLMQSFLCSFEGLDNFGSYQIYAGAYYKTPECFSRPDLFGFYDSDNDKIADVITVPGSGDALSTSFVTPILNYTQPPIVLEVAP